MKSPDYQRQLKRFERYWLYAALVFVAGAALAIGFQAREPRLAYVGAVLAFVGVIGGIGITVIRLLLTAGLFRSKVD